MKAFNLFALCLITVVSDAETDLVSVIADLIRVMDKPSSVIATLCWPLYQQFQFYYFLHRNDISQLTTIQFLKLGHEPKNVLPPHTIIFLLDLNCPNITDHIEMSNEKNLLRSPYSWILIGVDETDNKTMSNIVNVKEQLTRNNISPDSDVKIILFHNSIRNESYFEVTEIYKACLKSDVLRTQHYGYWDATNGFVKSINSNKPTAVRRLDSDGCEIAIAYVLTNNNSIHHLYDQIDDHIDTISKVNFHTTNHLLEFLNATGKYIFTDTWGYKLNGTWNGMSGYFIRGEVEIGGSPMFVTSERISFVEFISNPTRTSSSFVFQQPKLSYGNNLFLLSFRNTVWYSATALVILLFLALFVVTFWEWKKNSNENINKPDAGMLRPNVTDIVILIIGAACQQGSPVELKGSLGRIVLLVLFLSLMFLYTSYSANIVALLQSSSTQIKTLEDMLHSRMKFGVDDTVYSRYYFSIANEPIRKAIYETKVAPRGEKPRFMSMEEGIKNIQKGLFAFHMETGVGYKFIGKYFLEGEKCGLKEIPFLQVQDPWLAVRKNTPYKEMFKIGTKRILEHGLQDRENRLFYQKRPQCSSRGSNFVSVSMVDCYPALLVLFYGVLFALGILFLEIVGHRRQILSKKFHSKEHSMEHNE
nr:ionotropic receptor 75q.2 [Achelura yunnanensis]